MFHLPAQQLHQGVRDRTQRDHNGTQQPRRAAHDVHQRACPAQGILHSGSFRSDLTEDQDDQWDQDSSDKFAKRRGETQREHRCHTWSNDHRHAIHYEDGREVGVRIGKQAINLDGFRVARFHQVFEFNAADRGKRGFSSRGYGTQD